MLENKNHSIFQAVGIIGLFTLLSRIFGLYRDRIFAATFGAGDVLDAYNAAFRVPDFIFNVFILGTLSVAFIPVFTDYFVRDKEEAKKIANTVLTSAALGIGFLSLICFFFVPEVTRLIAPGFTGDKFEHTVLLTRIFLLSPIIFAISTIFANILTALRRFLTLSLAPIFYNLGIIFGVKFLFPIYGIAGLAYGVILGALTHLLINFIGSYKAGFRVRPNLDLKHPAMFRILKLYLPRIISMDLSQFSLIIAAMVGSTLASGSITVFTFANNLQSVPIGIFALSFAIAAFPALAHSFSKQDEPEFGRVLSKTVVDILYFVIPITVLLILLRAQIVRVVLGSGNFDFEATRLTANALGIFAISLFAQSLAPLFARAFFARHNTMTPVIINVLSLIVNGILSYILGKAYGVLGLTLAFTCASIFNMFFLMMALKKRVPAFSYKYILSPTIKIVAISLAMAITIYASLYVVQLFLPLVTGINVFLQGAISGALGLFVFGVGSWLLKIEQTKAAWVALRHRIF